MAKLAPTHSIRGIEVFEGALNRAAQLQMVEELREVARAAPMAAQMTPHGKRMSVRMTSAGDCGWVSDRTGYRYEKSRQNGHAWPPIPKSVVEAWDKLSGCARRPECCLVNYYGKGARMGMHRDADEADYSFPVVSISLGDRALFRIGSLSRGGGTESIWLSSGDVLVMGGEARLIYHGVDRIDFGSSALLPSGGRINLTLRVVN